ncbi:hypothetical protein HK102_006299 [Quaeritorhiza haematococci]|nr:hypothetical protein HK102_006299 [Quaeritorhiza haematococci]
MGAAGGGGLDGGAEDDEEGLGSKLDQMLEERFKYGIDLGDDDDDGGAGQGLDDDDDVGLNDETFGTSNDEVLGKDFDFSANNSRFIPPPQQFGTSAPTAAGNTFSSSFENSSPFSSSLGKSPIQSIWQDQKQLWGYQPGTSPMQSGLHPNAFPIAQQQPRQTPAQMSSLEEIEAQLLRQAQARAANGAPPHNANVSPPHPSQPIPLGASNMLPQQQHQQQLLQQQMFLQQQQLFDRAGSQSSPPNPNLIAAARGVRSVAEIEAALRAQTAHQRQQQQLQEQQVQLQQIQQMAQMQQMSERQALAAMNMPSPGNRNRGIGMGMGPTQPMGIPQKQPPRQHQQQHPGRQGGYQHSNGMYRNDSPRGGGGGGGYQRGGYRDYRGSGGDRRRGDWVDHREYHQQDRDYHYRRGPGNNGGGYRQQNNNMLRGDELMTQYEKELIAKIQISQLVSDDPYADDFYYQIYTSLQQQHKQKATAANIPSGEGDGTASESAPASREGLNWQQTLLMQQAEQERNGIETGRGNSLNITNQMQLQMQRLIEGRKQKPKGSSLFLEGALGKISLNSVRNPKQLIQVNVKDKAHPPPPSNVKQLTQLSHRKIMRMIENVYSCVLNLEQLRRRPPENPEGIPAWRADHETNIAEIMKEIKIFDSIALEYGSNVFQPHPLAYFLAYNKGKKVIPRLLRFLTPDQTLQFTTVLLTRLESIDVCSIPTGTPSEDVDLFTANVVPPLVGFVSEVPLSVVNALTRTLLERHNVVWVVKSKVGLAVLTMLLSRAEILKQTAAASGGGAGGQPMTPTEADLAVWTDLYNYLFAALHTSFASMFPTFPPASSDSTDSPNESNDAVAATVAADEVYVWQFLAAMAVGATTVDHQRVLVTEVREKVVETARRNDNPKALANVNLFLNALGLGIDASQLAANLS